MANHQTQYAGQQDVLEHIACDNAQRQCWQEVHNDHQRQIVTVLPHDNFVALQIAGIGKIFCAGGVVAQHPADMREPQAALS